MNSPHTRAMQKLALIATAVFSGCQMMAFVLYPYFAEATGLTLSSIVGAFSVGSLLFLWGSPYWVNRSERLGRKVVLTVGILGLLLSQVVLLLLVQGHDYFSANASTAWLWASRILYGLTASAIVPVSQAILAEQSEVRGRMQAMTRQSMSLHCGRLLGPWLVWAGLFLAADAPLWIAVGILIILLFKMIRLPSGNSASLDNGNRSAVERGFFIRNARLLGMALLLTIMVGILQSSLTIHIQTRLLLNARAAAQLTLQFLLLASIVTLVIQALMQAHIKNPWQGTLPAGALSLVISSLLVLNFETEYQLWWALPLFAIGVALLTPSYTAALSLQGKNTEQANIAGLLSVTHTLGYALGGGLVALLMTTQQLPLKAAFFLSLALLLLAFMVKAPEEQNLQTLTRDHA